MLTMIDQNNKDDKNPLTTDIPVANGKNDNEDNIVQKAIKKSTRIAEPSQNPSQSEKMPNNQSAEHIKQSQPQTIILPAIPIREGVLFPSTESVLTFGRKISLVAIQNITPENNMVVLITQKKAEVENPKEEDLYSIGTLSVIDKKIKSTDGINALVRGIARVKIIRFHHLFPKIVVEVEKISDFEEESEELNALVGHLQKQFRQAVHMGKPVEFLNFMKLMGGVTKGELTDQIASTLSSTTIEKQLVLETINVKERAQIVIEQLSREMKILEIEKDVVKKTQKKFDKNMRENVLRERLRTIQSELGELEDEEEIIDEYMAKIKKTPLPKEVLKKISKEIRRLKQMSPNNPESGYVRTWLDTVFELPWGKRSTSKVRLDQAESTLDKSHHALGKVKDRILEHIAVMELKQKNAKSESDKRLPTILCFVGPPGVGKTSIGKSIASALKRKFVKISLGGIRDEAEIRGHRRTYVGAMPGRIISGMKTAGSMNPVFMLDEIDKLSSDYRGDPSSALLEALDPEQNSGFEDHYLDLPFDLSEVIFITTANTLDTIPPALRDRLEIIRYSGYTNEEKFEIAKKHLLPKVRSANGLSARDINLSDSALNFVIERYTREAGVRSLERNIHSLMRKVARAIAKDNKHKKMTINPDQVIELLGPEKFDIEIASSDDVVGQATGLAWTSVGGDTLFIEVALYSGKGMVQLTGKLGEVMKESAQTAFTYVKSNAQNLGIDPEKIAKTNIHIHVPEGAVPKDGPSAGITITTAIVSAFTDKPVRKNIAMTGEVTLRGRVLRIGGLKEKSIAALRAGINTVIIPDANQRDLAEIPKSVLSSIKFIPVKNVSEVLPITLINFTEKKNSKISRKSSK